MLVRAFSPDDVAFAAQLSDIEGWGLSAQDYRTLLELEPHGSFVAEEQGRPVGIVTTIAYGKLAWIGNLVIAGDLRGKGYGKVLLDMAAGHLLDRGARTLGLDSTPEAVPFYERAGFNPVCEVLYWRRQASPAPAPLAGWLAPMAAQDLHAVTMFDWAFFGGRRRRVLRHLLDRSPVAYVAQDRAGVGGYLMARQGPEGWLIGPWVGVRAAEPLLTAALAAIGQEPVEMAAPSLNGRALEMLPGYGFQVHYREARMYHGDREGIGQLQHIYAIAGPDKG